MLFTNIEKSFKTKWILIFDKLSKVQFSYYFLPLYIKTIEFNCRAHHSMDLDLTMYLTCALKYIHGYLFYFYFQLIGFHLKYVPYKLKPTPTLTLLSNRRNKSIYYRFHLMFMGNRISQINIICFFDSCNRSIWKFNCF